MKPIITAVLGPLIVTYMCLTAFVPQPESSGDRRKQKANSQTQIQEDAFTILDTKCNSCHRKKNPFFVFSKKNITRRSDRIYLQVFVTKRMPKGDDIKLTENELTTLQQWLQTQNNTLSWN